MLSDTCKIGRSGSVSGINNRNNNSNSSSTGDEDFDWPVRSSSLSPSKKGGERAINSKRSRMRGPRAKIENSSRKTTLRLEKGALLENESDDGMSVGSGLAVSALSRTKLLPQAERPDKHAWWLQARQIPTSLDAQQVSPLVQVHTRAHRLPLTAYLSTLHPLTSLHGKQVSPLVQIQY